MEKKETVIFADYFVYKAIGALEDVTWVDRVRELKDIDMEEFNGSLFKKIKSMQKFFRIPFLSDDCKDCEVDALTFEQKEFIDGLYASLMALRTFIKGAGLITDTLYLLPPLFKIDVVLTDDAVAVDIASRKGE